MVVECSIGPGPLTSSPGAGGIGNTPPVSPPQGNDGGNALDGSLVNTNGGGGGGATAVGTNAGPGQGGTGRSRFFCSSNRFCWM